MGTGVLGPVYCARESDGDRTVAVKSFDLELTPEQVEVFGNALADVVNVEVSHPAILAPLAAGLESGTPFVAYEYVAGESLDVALRREARPPQAMEWILALAGAVDAAHARGLVHGALHLRDVLVSAEGVCATGFGIASALEHVRLGIPVRRPYTAPEVAAGRHWGPPADRFAVAMLAYELLTGTRPSGSSDQAIADLRELRPDVADPAGLQQAFRNALADEPAIRSASATAFVTALVRAVGDGAPEGSPAGRDEEAVAGPVPGILDETPDAAPARAVQIDLPDVVDAPGERSAGSDGREEHGERRPRSPRPSRSKRRPPRRTGSRRRTEPVVAVRDDVHFDPLDDRSQAEPAVERAGYDEDVPPPPSPTSMRAIAPVVAAMAVGVLVAYLVSTGLGTSGDEAADRDSQPSEVAGAGVEWSEETVADPEARLPSTAADAPLTLVEEPILPVGDPPGPGVEQRPAVAPAATGPAVEDSGPPGPAVAPAVTGPAVEDSGPPVASPPASTTVAPEAPPARNAPVGRADAGAGSLRVESRPPGATVLIDGVPAGATPLDVPDVGFGLHRVRIDLPGYRPWATTVDVSGTDRVRVGASLEPEGGR